MQSGAKLSRTKISPGPTPTSDNVERSQATQVSTPSAKPVGLELDALPSIDAPSSATAQPTEVKKDMTAASQVAASGQTTTPDAFNQPNVQTADPVVEPIELPKFQSTFAPQSPAGLPALPDLQNSNNLPVPQESTAVSGVANKSENLPAQSEASVELPALPNLGNSGVIVASVAQTADAPIPKETTVDMSLPALASESVSKPLPKSEAETGDLPDLADEPQESLPKAESKSEGDEPLPKLDNPLIKSGQSGKVVLSDPAPVIQFSRPDQRRVTKPRLWEDQDPEDVQVSASRGAVDKVIFMMIALVIIGIGVVTSMFVYLEFSPSAAKSVSVSQDTLSTVDTMNFSIDIGFDMQTEGQTTTSAVTYTASGKYDKPKREMQISGNYKAFVDDLTFDQTIIGNNLYIKYPGRDYITSNDLSKAILSIDDITLQNMVGNITTSTQLASSGEEVLDGVGTFRIKASVPAELQQAYLVNFIGRIVKSFYPLSDTTLTSSDISSSEFSYRFWVTKDSYAPVKLQLRIDQIVVDMGEEIGKVTLKDFQVTTNISGINQSVVIESPI